nr:class I SAM-dependent methyltransferase [Brevibacterium daeguense]
MSAIESAVCRSAAWRSFARRGVLPWALDGHALHGDVLEVGGGSGAMAAGVARANPEVQLTVTDVDDAMVESARTRLAAHRNVTVQAADVTALPFDSGTFDAVTSFLMLHHVVDWRAAVAEVKRVLKPGGAFIGYDLTDTRLAHWVHRADGSPHRILAPEELKHALRADGFTGITVSTAFCAHLMRFYACSPAAKS